MGPCVWEERIRSGGRGGLRKRAHKEFVSSLKFLDKRWETAIIGYRKCFVFKHFIWRGKTKTRRAAHAGWKSDPGSGGPLNFDVGVRGESLTLRSPVHGHHRIVDAIHHIFIVFFFFISTYLPIRFSLSLKGIIFTSKSCETYPFKIAAIYIIRAHSTFVYIFIYCPGIEVNPYSFSAFLIDLPFFGVVFSAIWVKLSFCNDEYRVNVASSINAPGYWNTFTVFHILFRGAL